MRIGILLCVAASLWASDDLRFSVGFKYWPGDFKTSQGTFASDVEGNPVFIGRDESGGGALGGITLAVTRGKWNLALTWMDGFEDYVLFKDEQFQTETRYDKRDIDLGVNYAIHQNFGVNLGYKKVETSSVTVNSTGQTLLSGDVDLGGIYAGAYASIPIEAAHSMLSVALGYGFLSTSDLKLRLSGTTTAYKTGDATGPTGEIAWNVLLGKFVISLGYKYQDFEYDTTYPILDFNDVQVGESVVSTKDAVNGLTLGVRYFF